MEQQTTPASLRIVFVVGIALVVFPNWDLDTLARKCLAEASRFYNTRELLRRVNLELVRERPSEDWSSLLYDTSAHWIADINEAHP